MYSVIITKEQIESIKVGDMLPNSFGFMNEVVEIYYKGFADNGKYFACFTLQFGQNYITTNSICEGQIMVKPR
jgi:hypothetical protein